MIAEKTLYVLVGMMMMTVWGNDAVDKQAPMDLYVFAYEWTPQYCYGQKEYKGCNSPNDYWETHLTIHGLWPEYSTGGYPQTCTTEKFDPSIIDKIGRDTLVTYWPNVHCEVGDADYNSFWEHEWSKHGTCSGLSQIQYFNQSLSLLQKLGTPIDLSKAVGGTLSADQLRKDFGGASKCSLKCIGNCLSEVYTCWEESNGVPTNQVDCPPDVVSHDSCSTSTLTIREFY